MKKSWLAAVLNIFPGLGYIYLNAKRPLGWLIAVSAGLWFASGFDSAPSYTAWTNSPYTIWDWFGLASLVVLVLALVIDGYREAGRRNKELPPHKELSKLPRGAYVPLTEFVLISLLTLGLYNNYWAWRAWENVRMARNEKRFAFTASLRAFFLVFSGFALFPKMDKLAREQGYKPKISGNSIAGWYLATNLLCVALSQFTAIPFLATLLVSPLATTLILLPAVASQNHYALATRGKYMPAQTNWWLTAVLTISWIFTAVSIVLI